ncbi:MAG TPA: alpha-E domain-containing protein [Acidimicrobiales bacterium]|nr:alpha-E domain-containing protein [Acidimicrobiales bacterium]
MLARHAESLFWAGRYVERASDTARMLDVTYHGLLESPPQEVQRAWLDLLEVLGTGPSFAARHADDVSEATVSRFLAIDTDNPGSVVSLVGRARENVRSVRELVSTEMWEAVNAFYLELGGHDLTYDIENQPSQLYSMVKGRCQAVAGSAVETMPHDDAWRFMMLGWMIERAEMTLRLLDVRYLQLADLDPQSGFHHWIGVLKSASAAEAYRRAYSLSMDRADVVEFLLLSEGFPRSVLWCLRSAEENLGLLCNPGRLSRAQRVLGRIRADLEYCDVHELISGDLNAFLRATLGHVRRVAELLALELFRNADEFDLHALEHS